MVLIGHGLLKSRHELSVLRWCLWYWNCGLYNGLKLPDYFGPRISIGRDQSILHFLGNLRLLSLSLHLFSDPLDLSLQGNILSICLCLGIYHGPKLCWRWWWSI